MTELLQGVGLQLVAVQTVIRIFFAQLREVHQAAKPTGPGTAGKSGTPFPLASADHGSTLAP